MAGLLGLLGRNKKEDAFSAEDLFDDGAVAPAQDNEPRPVNHNQAGNNAFDSYQSNTQPAATITNESTSSKNIHDMALTELKAHHTLLLSEFNTLNTKLGNLENLSLIHI